MTHSGSYPVTKQVNLPQPHVHYVTKPAERMSLSGWIPFIMAGIIAVTFMVFLHLFGGPSIFPTRVNLYAGMIPIVKKGILRVYPVELVSIDIESRYTTRLPPENLTHTVEVLDHFFHSYPKGHGNVYENCWLENPSAERPCFFDSSWIADICIRNNSYGYEESDQYYNPCIVMKLEQTKDWTPLPSSIESVPSSIAHNFDRGFMPVYCYVKENITSLKVTVYPPKGFSLLFFPVSKFDNKTYLAPFVAVKVEGIKKGDNVTLECSIITRNAFMLWNNGKVVIKFTSESTS